MRTPQAVQDLTLVKYIRVRRLLALTDIVNSVSHGRLIDLVLLPCRLWPS
jgi:hypothetical protein